MRLKLQYTNLREHRIGAELNVDPKTILATSHGRRSIDVMKLYDKSKANWECMVPPPNETRHEADILPILQTSTSSKAVSPKNTAPMPSRSPAVVSCLMLSSPPAPTGAS